MSKSPMISKRVLFVTWDGPQVQYLESLFLPIFSRLRSHGFVVDVLQFRWGSHSETAAVRLVCEAAGSGYRSVKVMRYGRSAGAFATALAGGFHVRRAAAAFRSDLLMPRSLMPAMAVLAACSRLPMLFDADGLPADEKVEFAGLSPTGPAYRILRNVEALAIRRAQGVLVRTPVAATILADRAKVHAERFSVVANGRDPDTFRPLDKDQRRMVRAELGIAPDIPLLVYAGSVGPQYRFDRIAAIALALRARQDGARLLLLSGDPDHAQALLGPDAMSLTLLRKVSPDKVASLLAAADIGLAFRATTFSTQAIAPVKLAEYLLCGLPVIGTREVGDTREAIAADVLFADTGDDQAAVAWIEKKLRALPAPTERARAVGLQCFSLERSVNDYVSSLNQTLAS